MSSRRFLLAALPWLALGCTLQATAPRVSPPRRSPRQLDLQPVVEPGEALPTRCTRWPKELAACIARLDDKLDESVQDLLRLYVAPRSERSPRYPARIEILALGHRIESTPEPPLGSEHHAYLTLRFRFTLHDPRGHALVQLEDEVEGPARYTTDEDLAEATRSLMTRVLERVAAALELTQLWRSR